MSYRGRIVRNPRIAGGDPVLLGTGVTIRSVLERLARGESIEAIVAAIPALSRDDVREVIAFAADTTLAELPPLGATGRPTPVPPAPSARVKRARGGR